MDTSFRPASRTGDGLLQITLMGGEARAMIVNSTALVEEARATHTTSNVATAALGRLLTVSCMMGAMLKGDHDSVTNTVKGDGPLGALVAVAHSDLTVKGYVDRPRVELPLRESDGKLDVGAAVGKGHLTVVKDLGMREPYVGQVELQSGEIAMDFTYYFAASEQQPSLISLGVLMPEAEDAAKYGVLSAGGLLVQPMPGCSEELLTQLEGRTSLFTDISRKLVEQTPEELCMTFFKGLEPQIVDRRVPRYRCDCSVERMERALISIGKQDLQEIISDGHGAQLECHFCNRRYRFSTSELQGLLESAQ